MNRLALIVGCAALLAVQARDTGPDRTAAVSPKDLSDPERSLVPGEEVAGNLAGSFDVGDYYLTPSGPRPLRRLGWSCMLHWSGTSAARNAGSRLSGSPARW